MKTSILSRKYLLQFVLKNLIQKLTFCVAEANMTALSTVGEALASGRINLDEPRWDQSSYMGRAKLFFTTTNPLNVFASSTDLDWAKEVVTKHKKVTKCQFH